MPRNLPTDLVLLQIAEGLQKLAQNPDLSKTITDAYALTASEKSKAEEARTLVAQADALRAEFKKREDALAIVNERIAQATKLESFNEDTRKLLAQKQRENEDAANKNASDKAANEAEASRLSSIKESLESDIEKQKQAWAEISAMKADLKKRAETIGAQVADLAV